MELEIGKRIKSLRLERSLTQEALAQHLGVSYQAISKWETGANTPDIALLPKLSVFFGVTIDDLFNLQTEDHFTRIAHMIDTERSISPENFTYAESFLKGALEQNPSNSECFCLLSKLYNHRAYNDHQLAAYYAKEGLIIDPYNRALHVYLGEATNRVIGDGFLDDHAEVIAYYQDFITRHPNYIRAYTILIIQLIADGHYSEAQNIINKGRQIEDYYAFYLFEGDIAASQGHVDLAISIWDTTIKKYPHIWQTYCHRADQFMRLGRVDEAIEDYYHCYEMQSPPRLTDGLHSLGRIYESQGEYKKAITIWQQLIDEYKNELKLTGEPIDSILRTIERLKKLDLKT